jgi:hypothetical protein
MWGIFGEKAGNLGENVRVIYRRLGGGGDTFWFSLKCSGDLSKIGKGSGASSGAKSGLVWP